MTYIGDYVFSGCTGLTSVTIGNSVTSIGSDAFLFCTGLTSVTIPNSVTSIGDLVFQGCTGLISIDVDVLNLSYSSTEGVLFNKAGSVLWEYPAGKAGPYTLPNSVTSIGNYAFHGCTGLTSVTIPNSVTSIGAFVFAGCTGLTSIDVDVLNLYYSSTDGVLFDKARSVLVAYPPGRAGPYTIPNSVTSIGYAAFSGCTGLTSVTIPNSVTSIENWAFYGCTGLTSVTIPNRVTSIGYAAFEGCTGLTSVYFEGTPPTFCCDLFSQSPFVTVFHLPGAVGWGPTFNGRPTAVWTPLPAYADWVQSTGLAAQFPAASAEADDPDGDGMTNYAEWLAGTDPTQRASRLEMELTPRPADLTASDQTPIAAGSHSLYFRSVPCRYYGVQAAGDLGGRWELQAVAVAGATQTRFVVVKPQTRAFYRVLVLP